MSFARPDRPNTGHVIEFAIKCEGDVPRNWRLTDRTLALAAKHEIIAVLAKYAFREARDDSRKQSKSAKLGHANKKQRSRAARQKIFHP